MADSDIGERRTGPCALLTALVVLVLAAGACGSGDERVLDQVVVPAPTAEPVPGDPPEPSPQATTGLEFAIGHRLDVVGAGAPGSDLPVVVVLRPSDHTDLGRFLPTLAATGVVVFDAPWRPTEQGGRYPTVMEEASCAVGYARDHAAAFGGDPTSITLVAHSAGSYIAALAGFAAYDGDCTSSADLPDRMVGIAGIYQALTPEERQEQDAGIAALVGGAIEDHPDEYADLQLGNHLGENPTLRIMLIHGDDDEIVPVAQTTAWHERLVDAGYEVDVHVIEGGDHTSVLVDEVDAAAVASWIRDFADPAQHM
ncbi:MAG: alpha/beta hydrolase [Acidimicrobiia bacterium]|nr:alpha/beta hydrolase [Acidimicrobiia bacterium]